MAALTAEVRAFLRERRFATLATINPDGSPQQRAMWYVLDEETILMNTVIRRVKYRNLVRDPRASMCVLEGYRVVTISGQVELIEDQAIAQANIRRLAIRFHGLEQGEQLSRERFSKEQRVTLRLHMEQVIEDVFNNLFRGDAISKVV
jgi:PPOX class probable F420-dependent enzyme